MKNLFFLLPLLFLISCKNKVDAIYYNTTIYTVDKDDSIGQAMVVNNGKIVCVANKNYIFDNYDSKNKINLNGKFVYPGFIDSHCHLLNYGLNLSILDLKGTESWEDVVDKVKAYAMAHPDGWITAYGWDQNEWPTPDFPTNDLLNKLFPTRPVFLKSLDGHACIVNNQALKIAGITTKTIVMGGEIITKNKKLTGILLGNASDVVEKLIPKPTTKEIESALLAAQNNCLAAGLTTIDDAGITKQTIDVISNLQKQNKFKLRIYAMLADNDENRNYYFKYGPIKTNNLHICAFNYDVDGSLNSGTALLLRPYTDAPTETGLQFNSTSYFENQAQLCYKYGFQMCADARGDSAIRTMLQIYGNTLKGKNDKRWRIEHCQVIAPGDFELFADYDIVPSIQTIQATSQVHWVINKLGIYRVRGSYAYRILLYKNGYLAYGSNFPVEDINPMYGFYAAVSRQDQKGYPPGGFQVENGLTRQMILYAMTIWAAKANFEDDEKGSLESGKFADFVVLDKNIMTIPYEQTFSTKILATYINGEKAYGYTSQ